MECDATATSGPSLKACLSILLSSWCSRNACASASPRVGHATQHDHLSKRLANIPWPSQGPTIPPLPFPLCQAWCRFRRQAHDPNSRMKRNKEEKTEMPTFGLLNSRGAFSLVGREMPRSVLMNWIGRRLLLRASCGKVNGLLIVLHLSLKPQTLPRRHRGMLQDSTQAARLRLTLGFFFSGFSTSAA